MYRHIIGSLWDRSNRNGANKNFEYLFEGRQKIDTLNKRAEGILTEAHQTNNMNKDVQRQLNNIILENGDSEAEVVQARGGLPLLKDRLDESDAQLAQTHKQKIQSNISNTSTLSVGIQPVKRPLVTFIDDDGYSEVGARLKPIFDSKGIKGTLAIVSDWVGKPGFLSREEILTLQNEGWEIASHEKTHIAMGSVTDETIIQREIIQSKEELLKMGFNVKNIVYPFGQTSEKLIEYAKRVYRAGSITTIATNDSTVTYPLDTFRIRRVDFSKSSLAHYKSVVDKAVAENSWVIFMTHINVQTLEHDQVMSDLIDYIQSLNVDIVTFDEGLDTFGDKVSVEGAFRILPDNSIITDKYVVGIRDTLIDSAEKANDLQFIRSLYGENSVVYTRFLNSNAVGMPSDTGGILITEIASRDGGYPSQEYKEYNNEKTWVRRSTSGLQWTPWKLVTTKKTSFTTDDSLEFGSIAPKKRARVSVPVPGVNLLDNVIVTPQYQLSEGLIYNHGVASNTVRIDVTNITDNNIVVPSNRWNITVL